MNCKEVEVLISGYIDCELTQQESQRVRIHIEECESCGKIYRELKQVKEKMGELSYPNTDLEMLEEMENDLLSNTGQWSAWILILVSAAIFTGIGLISLREFFTSPETPIMYRLATGGIMLGGIILFLTVLRQRLKIYKNDRYKKVKL